MEVLVGKAPMRRTTSVSTGFGLDNRHHDEETISDHASIKSVPCAGLAITPTAYVDDAELTFLATVLPRPRRRSSDGRVETAHFLRACGFCHRRLAPGKDIFMYRGDVAFCSQECRQRQINQDEGKRCLALVKKEEGANASSKGGTIVAA